MTYALKFLYIFQELGTEFEFVGKGSCRSRCHAMGGSGCYINQYYKELSNIDECKLTCKNEVACTGFSIAYQIHCYIYGNISSADVESWENPDAWRHDYRSPKFTFGYEGFKVSSSDDFSKYVCFKRLDEGESNDGKFFSFAVKLR